MRCRPLRKLRKHHECEEFVPPLVAGTNVNAIKVKKERDSTCFLWYCLGKGDFVRCVGSDIDLVFILDNNQDLLILYIM